MKSLKQSIPPVIKRALRSAVRQLPLPAGLKLKIGFPLSGAQKRGMIHRLMNGHQAPKKGESILFWRGPSRGSINVELMIGLAMKLRGFEVQFVICDGALSGCIQRGIDKEPLARWGTQCLGCVRGGIDALETVGLSHVGIGELVSSQQQEELRAICSTVPDNELDSYEYRGIPVGLFAKASTQRYLRGHSLEGHDQVLREYLYSALVCTEAARTSLSLFEPNRVFMQQHDFYVGWAPALRIAMGAELPVIFWGGGAYEDGGIGLRPARNVQFQSLSSTADKSWQERAATPLTKEENDALDAYLAGRYRKRETSAVQKSRGNQTGELLRKFNITGDKPIWCIFSHVIWGEAANFDPMIYEDTVVWMLDTICITSEIRGVTWLVKVHPAEARATVHGIEGIIREAFPEIEWDKRIIPATSDISLQDLFPILSGGVTISGTPGLELALRGIPVVLAGQAHYGGKGFTYDAPTREQYAELLRNASRIGLLSEGQRRLARRYAYSLFFQRRVPLNMGSGAYRFAPLDFRKLDLLLPGRDPAMDMICEHIIDGGEFIL